MSFQRSPTVDGVLDFTNKLHKTVYDEGCKKLEGPSYDLCASGRHTFLTSLTFRSQKMKWSDDGTGILDYPTGATSASGTLITKNVLECDGELDLEALKIWVQSFVSSESRAAQDDDMLFNCIVNSLSSDGMVKVYSRYDDFTTAGYNSGILLMKVVLEESGLKTNAKIMADKEELSNLPVLMTKLKHNVLTFNTQVEMLVLSLKRNGAEAPDLLHQLFPAYLSCPDKKFTEYMGTKQNKFEEGKKTTAVELMSQAKFKYKTLVDKGQWEAPDAQDTQILALQAQIKQLQGGRKGKRSRDNDTDPNSLPPKRSRPDITWMKKYPGKSGPFTKMVNGKQFNWCSTKNGAPTGKGCNKWVRHDPKECKGFKGRKAVDTKTSTPHSPRNPKTSKTYPKTSIRSKSDERELQVKAATILLQRTKLEDMKPPTHAEVAEITAEIVQQEEDSSDEETTTSEKELGLSGSSDDNED